MRHIAVVLFLASAAAFAQSDTGSEAQQAPTIAVPADVQALLTAFEKAYAAKDGPGVASLFMPDGMEMLANRPPVRGRDAIEKFYSNGGQSLTFRPIVFAASGDVAFLIGGYSLSSAPAGDPDGNKFVFTLRKVAGRWLIQSAMSSSNRPQQPRPPRPAAQE